MFEFLSSANKKTVQDQVDYFERALKESQSQDSYYPERDSTLNGESASAGTIRRPSEESIGKAREWIAVQRKDYPDSKEILDLCKRWEELFDAYQKKMKAERAAIQAQGAEARAQMKTGNGKVSPNGVKNFDGGEGRYGYRVDTGWGKKGGPAPKAETVVAGEGAAAGNGGKPDAAKPSETVVAQASAELSQDFPRQFNESHLKEFKDRIDKVIAKLAPLATEEGSKDVKNLAELRAISAALDAVLKNPDVATVTKLQEAILAILKNARFTKGRNDGKPDGLFGPITLENLEKAVAFAKESADAQTDPAAASASAATPGAAPAASAPASAPAKADKKRQSVYETGDSGRLRNEFAFSKGGKFHIVGKDGNAELVSVAAFPPELLQQLEKMDAVGSKFADLFFLLSAYQAKYPEANFGARAAEIQSTLEKSDPTNVAGLEKILEHYVASFTTDKPNLKRIKDVFAASSDWDRKARLFSFVRNELGQYDMVAAAIADRAMEAHDIGPDEMAAITSLVKQYPESPEKAAAEFKKSGAAFERVKTNAGFGADQKAYLALFKKLSASYSDAKAHLRKNDAAIAENVRVALEKTGKSKDFAKEKAALEDRVLEQFLSASAAREILTASIAKKGPGTSTEYVLYKDIEGIGALDWSDRTYDVGKEVGILVATELLAMGVGMLTAGAGAWAVNAAVYGTRGIKLAERYAMVARMANSTGKIATGTRWIAGTALEGALIYEGTNTVRNVIDGRDWFEGAGDKKEILKSMVFVGALKGLAKLSAKVPGLAAKEGDDLSKLMVKGIGRISLEGLGIGAASWAVDVYFGDGEWTRDQFVEGIVMALVLRALGKAKAVYLKPRAGGGVSASEPVPTAPAPATAAAATPAPAPVRPARAEGRGTPERSAKAAELAQIRKDVAAKKREIRDVEGLIALNEPGAAAHPQANDAHRARLSELQGELAALETRAASLSWAGPARTPAEAATRPESPRAVRAGKKMVDFFKNVGEKTDLSWLKPVGLQDAVSKRFHELSHAFVENAKAAPGGVMKFAKDVVLGNTHGGAINSTLSVGKGPMWPFTHRGHGSHGDHGGGLMSKAMFGGTIAVNEINKINDTPGGFGAWLESLTTKHGITAEVVDLIATVAFIRTVGWAREIAYESAAEKFTDDNWSTNIGTKFANWAFGPVAAPVELPEDAE